MPKKLEQQEYDEFVEDLLENCLSENGSKEVYETRRFGGPYSKECERVFVYETKDGPVQAQY